MNRRQHFFDCVNFVPGARPLLGQTLWLMPGVKESWLKEGITQREIDQLIARTDDCLRNLGIATHVYPPLSQQVIEETKRYWVRINEFGATEKFIKGLYATRGVIIEHPVKNKEDWQKLKPRFTYCSERFTKDWKEKAYGFLEEGFGLQLSCHGFYGFSRELLGDENLCLYYYENPELVHDINETYCRLLLNIADRIEKEGIKLDSVYFWEDLAGKTGPIFGPKQFKEFLYPYYRVVTQRFRQLGAYHFMVDSDGNVEIFIPLFMETGINSLFPFECQAGMDIVKIRKKYPHLVMSGGLDKRVFVRDKTAIDKELEYRLPPMIKSGGYISSIDHRVLLGTTFKSFSYYINRVADMFGIGEKNE